MPREARKRPLHVARAVDADVVVPLQRLHARRECRRLGACRRQLAGIDEFLRHVGDIRRATPPREHIPDAVDRHRAFGQIAQEAHEVVRGGSTETSRHSKLRSDPRLPFGRFIPAQGAVHGRVEALTHLRFIEGRRPRRFDRVQEPKLRARRRATRQRAPARVRGFSIGRGRPATGRRRASRPCGAVRGTYVIVRRGRDRARHERANGSRHARPIGTSRCTVARHLELFLPRCRIQGGIPVRS